MTSPASDVRLLVVEDRATMREFLVAALEGGVGPYRCSVAEAADGPAALAALEARAYDLVLTDLKLPGSDGLAVLARAKALYPDCAVIVLTAYGTIETAVAAMRQGAYDFLTKPVESPDALRLVVERALDGLRLRKENESLRAERPRSPGFGDIVHSDSGMARAIALARAVAATPSTVLLLGESGTGKELFARAIHAAGRGEAAPFVAVNCAALPADLLESELFGHERGAFTGATNQRKGRFELADGGTLFLDEVGEIALPVQAKLLRVLQEGTFERVGASRTQRSGARIIAATNRDLKAMVAEGRFREDLYYRLAVFPITLPPLRERPGDILPLAQAVLVRLAQRSGATPLRIPETTAQYLRAYDWPGNVRELHNVLERATILATSPTLEPDLLPVELTLGAEPEPVTPNGSLRELERDAILQALDAAGGHRRRAAERLGISVRTLQYRLKAYGLVRQDEPPAS